MISSFVKVAWRLFVRYKGFSLINVVSLAIGLAVCALIMLYVQFELSYDTYQENADRIYRVVTDAAVGDQSHPWATGAEPLGPAIEARLPGASSVARIQWLWRPVVRVDETVSYESRFFVAEPEILEILDISCVHGNRSTALTRPGTLVLTESVAEKYFGTTNVVGRSLLVDGADYEITAIVPNPPGNTHLKFRALVSWKTMEPSSQADNWGRMSTFTYIKLAPGETPGTFEDDINRIVGAMASKALEGRFISGLTFSLQALPDIHLTSDRLSELEPPGSLPYILIFSGIGLLILLTAVVNFVSLATARSIHRGKEIGLRKIVGANRRQIVSQCLGETGLMVGFATVLAGVFADLLLPILNDLTGLHLTGEALFGADMLVSVAVLWLAVSLLAGSYPAFVISAFDSATVIRHRRFGGSTSYSAWRRFFVVGQFSAAVILVICVLSVYSQLRFMRSQSLGFNIEQKLVLPVPGDAPIATNYEELKSEFLRVTGISGVTASAEVPGEPLRIHLFGIQGEKEAETRTPLYHMFVDHDFASEYGLHIKAGRSFKSEIASDIDRAVILNETAIMAFGWATPEEALGKSVGADNEWCTVIGVVSDFHYSGLQQRVNPLVMQMSPSQFNRITLTLDSPDLESTSAAVAGAWQQLYPDIPFEGFFLDQAFDMAYGYEDRIGQLAGGLAFLAIFVSCLGLLAQAACVVERRTGEVGIRKVLGASVWGIFGMLTRELVILALIGSALAWPIAYFVADRWLEDFAYRVDLSWGVFVLSTLIVIVIAIATVSYQAVRGARANPVEALRYE